MAVPQLELGPNAALAPRGSPGSYQPGSPNDPAMHPSQPAWAPNPVMPGWDEKKWNDPNKKSPKYDIGHILSRYAHTPAGLQQALPDIQKLYPGVGLSGLDTLTGIPGDRGPGMVDVLKDARTGGSGWWWGTEDPAGPPITPATMPNMDALQSLLSIFMQRGGQQSQPGQNPFAGAGGAPYTTAANPYLDWLRQERGGGAPAQPTTNQPAAPQGEIDIDRLVGNAIDQSFQGGQ